MDKIREFFQDMSGNYSMSRLLLCGSFLVSSITMFILVHCDKMDEVYFTTYLSVFAGTYGFGKYQDSKNPASPPQV